MSTIYHECDFLADGAPNDSIIFAGPHHATRAHTILAWLCHHLFTITTRYVASATIAQEQFPSIILDVDDDILHTMEALLAAAAVAIAPLPPSSPQ